MGTVHVVDSVFLEVGTEFSRVILGLSASGEGSCIGVAETGHTVGVVAVDNEAAAAVVDTDNTVVVAAADGETFA